VSAWGQGQAPPQVEQDLRARVTGFYQNFLESSYSPRKAEPFVAEDTKDYYYSNGKGKYKSFLIQKITFSDNFKTAIVSVVTKEERHMAGQSVVMDVPVDTHWKLEDGKWVWTYHPEDYPLTPMGGMNPPKPVGEAAAGAVIPKNTSPEAIRAAGLAVLDQQPMGFDKTQITFVPSAAGSTEVVFTNGAAGEVQIGLDGPVVRGLSVSLDKTTVPGHGTATVRLRYTPTDQPAAKDVWEPKGIISFRLVVAPFNRVFPFYVSFPAPHP